MLFRKPNIMVLVQVETRASQEQKVAILSSAYRFARRMVGLDQNISIAGEGWKLVWFDGSRRLIGFKLKLKIIMNESNTKLQRRGPTC